MPNETFATLPSGLAAAVVGDVMIDDNLMLDFGTTCPTAFGRDGRRAAFVGGSSGLGGAGNVAANLSGLGVQTALVGMTGDDQHGGRLHALARVRPYLAQMLFVCAGLKTPRKLRLYGRHTLDTVVAEEAEPRSYYSTARAAARLLPTPTAVCEYLAESGVRVFCEVDHGKGFFLDHDDTVYEASTFRRALRATGVPVIADPRPCTNWPYITGGRVILKMNHEQLNAVVGKPAGREWVIPGGHFPEEEKRRHFDAVRAEILAGRLIHCDYLWLTYGASGMSLGPLDGVWSVHADAYHAPDTMNFDDPRLDATGCGDTCTAVMAHTIADKGYTAAAVVDGFLYANRAAGVAAAYLGCHVMTKKTFEGVKRGVTNSQDRYRVLAGLG